MPHGKNDDKKDIANEDLAYWNSRCAKALIALEEHPMEAHHLSALAMLAEDIALELSSKSPSSQLSRRLRIVS